VSDLPIFFQLAIVSFVMALVFSFIWVYLIPERTISPTEDLSAKEDQEMLNHEAFKNRRQAQERLFTHLEETQHLRQQRQEINAKPYQTDLLPINQPLTLYALFDRVEDFHRALVHLQADELTISPDQFDLYWTIPHQSYWAWQGDNILEPYGETELKQMMRERYAQMKGVLLVSGWVMLRETKTDFNLISCYERTR
jgi:hypothetical protein